jgi:hypothetical protein
MVQTHVSPARNQTPAKARGIPDTGRRIGTNRSSISTLAIWRKAGISPRHMRVSEDPSGSDDAIRRFSLPSLTFPRVAQSNRQGSRLTHASPIWDWQVQKRPAFALRDASNMHTPCAFSLRRVRHGLGAKSQLVFLRRCTKLKDKFIP